MVGIFASTVARTLHLRLANPVRLDRYASSLGFYRTLLGIRSVRAVSDRELHIEYDVPSIGPSARNEKNTITLILQFDPASRRLTNAHVSVSAP